jgi:hypothetical protein
MALVQEATAGEAPPSPGQVLRDARIEGVIARLLASRSRPAGAGPRAGGEPDPHAYAGYGFSIHPQQGELLYLLCRALNARRVIDFATSVGFSTLYLAAAMRDNGGGRVIGAEIVPQKIATPSATSRRPDCSSGWRSARAMPARRCALWAVTSISPSSMAGRRRRARRWRCR